MIAAWMLSYLAVGGLLLVVAFAADAVLARLRLPRRWAWMTVILAMCVLPLLLRNTRPLMPMFVSADRAPTVVGQLGESGTVPDQESMPSEVESAAPSVRGSDDTRNRIVIAPDSPFLTLDRWALLLWVIGSASCGVLLLAAHRRMARARREWTSAPNDIVASVRALTGTRTRVWCSGNIGPAAFGVLRPQIVLPAWAMTLEEASSALLLRHEASHVISRDPLLLRIALTCVIAMPWNLPILFAYRRLHRAVEHDCDARVLSARTDAKSYARLLLDTAERLSDASDGKGWTRAARWLPAPVPGIGSRRSELEARLRAMLHPVSTWQSRARTVGAATVAAIGVLAACSVPSPERMRFDSLQSPLATRPGIPANDRQSPPTSPTAPRALSALDSVKLMESRGSEIGGLTRRGLALQDSIIEASVRAAVPEVFQLPGKSTDLFVLLDEDYRVMRSKTGRQFFSVAAGDKRDPYTGVSAHAKTPTEQLILSSVSFLRAFPDVRAGDLGAISEIVVIVGNSRITVPWTRYMPKVRKFTVPTGPARALARERSFDESLPIVASEHFVAWIEQLAAPYVPGLLLDSPNATPVLWLLLATNGDELAHASGRNGLYGTSPGGGVASPPHSNPATIMTPDSGLGIHCGAFGPKFPAVNNGAGVKTCGMFRIMAGGRVVVIVFGLTERA